MIQIQRFDPTNLKEVISKIYAQIDKYDPKYAICSLLWFSIVFCFIQFKLWRNIGLAESASYLRSRDCERTKLQGGLS